MIYTLDFVVLRYVDDDGVQVLLRRRDKEPYTGALALPGGWIFEDKDATLDDAYQRIITEKVGLATAHVEQVCSDGSADRDPRGWSTTTYYLTFLDAPEADVGEGMHWVPVTSPDLEFLPFDHHVLIKGALERLATKAQYSTLPAFLLERTFTLSTLERAYETLLGGPINTSAFRKRIEKTEHLRPTEEFERIPGRRPTRLFQRLPSAEPEFYERLIGVVG